MEESVLLMNMTILLLLGGLCSIMFRKLRMPAIIGYLVSGIILANYWVGESEDTESIVEFLSDLGLVMMMFCIGMELNLKKLRKMGSFAILVVMIQVPLILAGGIICGMLLGLDGVQSVIFGAIISGSSTAVVTVVLHDQDRLSHQEMETIILITVIEDVAQVIILSAVTPLMSGETMSVDSIVWMLLIIVAFMAIAIVVGLLTLPKVLDWIGERMPDEILLIIALGLCFLMAYLGTLVGLSMAIGSFMMGVVVSQAKGAKIIEHDITPMKDIFMMMFFISIGLQIRPESLVDNILLILSIYLIYFSLKAGTVILAYFVGNKPLRVSFLSSISLCAMGEFAFIIGKEAFDAGMLSEDFYAAVIGAALVSMIVLPMLDKQSDKIVGAVQNRTPQPIVNAFMRLEKVRSDFYSKMALASKTTMQNLRTRMTYAYFAGILIFIVEMAFFVFTPYIAEFINLNTSEAVSIGTATLFAMTLNFIALIPLTYKMVFNLSFIEKVMLDSNRRAKEAGRKSGRIVTSKAATAFVELNIWVLAILIDFLIVLVVPNEISLLGHLLVLAVGVAIIAGAQLLLYINRR